VLVAGGGFLVGRLGSDDHGHRATGAESAALQNTVWQLLGYDHDQLRTSSLSMRSPASSKSSTELEASTPR